MQRAFCAAFDEEDNWNETSAKNKKDMTICMHNRVLIMIFTIDAKVIYAYVLWNDDLFNFDLIYCIFLSFFHNRPVMLWKRLRNWTKGFKVRWNKNYITVNYYQMEYRCRYRFCILCILSNLKECDILTSKFYYYL